MDSDKWRTTYYDQTEDQYSLQGDYELDPLSSIQSHDLSVPSYGEEPVYGLSIFKQKSYWIGVMAGSLLGYFGLPKLLKRRR